MNSHRRMNSPQENEFRVASGFSRKIPFVIFVVDSGAD